MGPTGRLDERGRASGLIKQMVIASKGIGLDDGTTPSGGMGLQMRLRVIAGAGIGELEQNCRRVGSPERSVITHIGPKACGLCLTLIE